MTARKKLTKHSTIRRPKQVRTRTSAPTPQPEIDAPEASAPTDAERCSWCGGTAVEPPLPNLTGVSQNQLAKHAGLDPSSLSRIFSGKPGQGRKDPKLSTLRKLQLAILELTGRRVPLDMIGAMLE